MRARLEELLNQERLTSLSIQRGQFDKANEYGRKLHKTKMRIMTRYDDLLYALEKVIFAIDEFGTSAQSFEDAVCDARRVLRREREGDGEHANED